MKDPFNLARFVDAQNDHGSYERAIAELEAGAKVTHWMWFVFPQIAGLGSSATSRYFSIRSLEEARAYLAHNTLGPRLERCAQVVAGCGVGSAPAILGEIDAAKLRSSMTLFLRAAPNNATFAAILDRFFGGEADPATDHLLAERTAASSKG